MLLKIALVEESSQRVHLLEDNASTTLAGHDLRVASVVRSS